MPEVSDKRPLKVFLCHASADKPKVRELYRTLKRRGVQPWLDAENLIPGQNWEVEIPKAILSADAIIICLSLNSVDKEGYVQKEIKFALDKALEMPDGRIFIIPAKLEECDLPFSLRQYQAVNLYEKEGYTRLMKALKLRALQLERNTVELPKEGEVVPEIKKIAEEKKSVEPKQDKPGIKTAEPSSEPSVPSVDMGGFNITGGENVINIGVQETHVSEKPKIDKQQPKKAKSPGKPNTAIIVALIGLAGTIIAALLNLPSIQTWLSPASVSTASATATITLTVMSVTPSQTMEPSPTLAATNTPTLLNFNDPHPVADDYHDAFGVPMRLVASGNFMMGSDQGQSDERPVHPVYLDAYYMDKYEVTNALYKACVDAEVCPPPQDSGFAYDFYGNSDYDNFPVMFMGWNMAKTYCAWRGAQLPTEAQWEKAAHGMAGGTYPWGEGIDQTFANYGQSGGIPSAVGSYERGKSSYGVYDLAGNVSEWVEDWYSNTFYANSPNSNPSGPGAGQYRVLRGGTWYDSKEKVRASDRSSFRPDAEILASFGFRCAKDANP